MSIAREKVNAALARFLHLNALPPGLEDFDRAFRLAGDESPADLLGIVRELWEWARKVSHGLSIASEGLDVIYREVANGVVVAAQRLVISSDTLSTTDVTNDTITTLSQTDYAFNWTDFRRASRIVVSPGEGVRPYGLVADKVLHDIPTYDGMVWAKAANELQRVHWNGTTWEGKAWDEGWTVDLVQYIPSILEAV